MGQDRTYYHGLMAAARAAVDAHGSRRGLAKAMKHLAGILQVLEEPGQEEWPLPDNDEARDEFVADVTGMVGLLFEEAKLGFYRGAEHLVEDAVRDAVDLQLQTKAEEAAGQQPEA